MTIINANYYLEQLLAPAALERIARLCKFCLRQRAITPAMLVPGEHKKYWGSVSYAAIAGPFPSL
ncbi:hypothetical protein [Klebsiella pneumoniae]|uniref:hypothetical protein n=1 Tax=Klebsiella pneumoniae TaxID=573 RepID=UPI00292A9094|nr:hypothetical protein [Klebsiella pneumoniae]MDV1010279.1 hypothetical protein [Klebsiella pneumoniae]MDV1049138.1 hypothetical protein [Klebsiella pneumoniae]MDV1644606.1 hypothetical protein [Klebsiella pneumoniae]